jgi:hypothetical protein
MERQHQPDLPGALHPPAIAGELDKMHLQVEIKAPYQVCCKDEGAFENTYQQKIPAQVIAPDISCQPGNSGFYFCAGN